MAEYNIRELRQRYLRRPPVSKRRLEHTSLELDINIEHSEDEKLALKTHETLGVGYGFDRLYYLDLSQEQPVPRPLPGRHELQRYYRDKSPANLAYGGHEMLFGSQGARTGVDDTGMADFNNFAEDGVGHATITNNKGTCVYNSSSSGSLLGKIEGIAKAFIGPGSGGSSSSPDSYFGWRVNGGSGNSADWNIFYDDLCDFANNRQARNFLQAAYANLSPSAWETLLANRNIYAEIPKLLPYLDKAFFSLYDRDKIGAFKTRLRDPQALITVLSMIEAMYTIRRARFSKNVAMAGNDLQHVRNADDDAEQLMNGVLNAYFWYMESDNHKVVVAPWFIINKLNNVLYLDTDRDEEVRDVERKDITEFMTILTQAMEVEKGLGFSSEQNNDLLVFEKYADGEIRDMTDFKDDKAALAATFLGHNSARDVYYRRPNKGIGRLPYYHTLLAQTGSFIGKERVEFLDRVKEQSEHTMLCTSPEHFKNGMQYANAFDYTTNLTRTRFGDHSIEMVVHPYGFFRGLAHGSEQIEWAAIGQPEGKLLNLQWFPVYNWGQMAETCDTYGILPNGMNGAYYATGLKTCAAQENNVNDSSPKPLWSANYPRPGYDNYCARLLKSTDEMLLSWMDRGEQVRAEGAVFPAVTTMNLIAEKLFTTPMAMLQRNFPFLRKIMGRPASGMHHGAVSFDFMTAGDNRFGMSVYHNAGHAGPLSLRNRNLFDTASHLRTDEVQLAPIVMPLTKPPENWVSLFQTRDALYFLTSMLSEPIMDAYTSSVTTTGPSNGYGASRLVVYQGPKNFEGVVEDVYCTPIVGTGVKTSDGSPIVDYTLTATTSSCYPTATGGNNNYIMFLFGSDRMAAGTSLRLRHGHSGSTASATPWDPSAAIVGSSNSVSYDEDDFVPGLYWDKLWVQPWPTDSNGDDLTWEQTFSHPDLAVAVSGDPGIGYLQSVNGNANGEYLLGADINMDQWRVDHGRWIEGIRTNLEYQRASPSFYIIDLDITDTFESDLRASLFPLGKTTVGPLTFVGSLGHDGNQELSETITGEACFEIIDLTVGAGDLDESPTDPDDEGALEENPSMHIATQQDV
jgi:hypothetical protein